jgi:predicted GIY-YIG superfamily endonuclease
MPTFTTLGHCVYVLFSEADGKLYIGYSSNLKQRLITSTVGTRPQPPPAAPANLL